MSACKQFWVLLALETNANLLKPCDITRLKIQKILESSHKVQLCVLYGSQNNHRFLQYTLTL